MTETVLITGASSGIGKELAYLFAADGARLLLVARTQQRLQELATDLNQRYGTATEVFVADLSQPDAPQHLFDWTQARGLTVDVLVNNAGFGAHGPFVTLPLKRQLDMIQVNVTALTHLSRLFLPDMIARRRGGLLNVASTAAFQPGPYMAVYYATKAYVLHFTEALAEEVSGTPITVSCLAPGPTATHFAEEAHLTNTLLFKIPPMSARKVAQAGYRGFRKGKVLIIPGWRNKLGVWLIRCTPRSLARKIVKQLQAPAQKSNRATP